MDFQKNTEIKFKRDTSLLKKAEELKPQLHKLKIIPKEIVSVEKDKDNIFGYSAKTSHQKISLFSSYTYGKDQRIVIDLGNHYVGRFEIDLDSVGSPMDAPLFLHLKFAEVPVELAEDSDEYQGALSKSWLQDEYVHIDSLPTRLKLSRRYSCRYIAIDVIDSSPKWRVKFSNPIFIAESSVKLNEVEPVKTADEELNRIDTVGLKTLQDCMQQVFEDGPKRDRRLWLGDLHLQALANYATFNDKELVERCLYLFGAVPAEDGRIPTNVFTFNKVVPDDTFFFDYGLFFISTLLDFYKQYQDKKVVDDLYQTAKDELDEALKKVDQNNMIKLDKNWITFVDWNMSFDRDTCTQAILIYSLKQFIQLAELEDESDIKKYQEMLSKLINSAKSNLFDYDQQMFISGENKEINLPSQVWMVLAHVFTDEENEKLMDKVIKKFFPVRNISTPYMYHFIVEALFQSNHYKDAVQLIKNYWGTMIDYGADTFWEAFDPSQPDVSPYGSLAINSFCHAWSCTPVYLIRKYITNTIK